MSGRPAGRALTLSQRIDRVIAAAGMLSALLGAAFLVRAGHYYLLPLWDRPDNPLNAELNPSATIGHSFGWAGAGLMLLGVALYSGRKRLAAMRGRGPMRTWLNLHIYLCLVGPFLVTLHTAGKLGGLGVYTFWSMWIVAASGIIGRWLYQQFPRTIRGDLMTLGEMHKELAVLRERLAGYGLAPALLAEIDALATRGLRHVRSGDPAHPSPPAHAAAGAAGGLAALPVILVHDLTRPLRLAGIRRRLRRAGRLSARDRKAVLSLIRRQTTIARRIAFLDTFRRVFSWWHVIHLAFFAAMVALLFLHVGSELFFGASLLGGGGPS